RGALRLPEEGVDPELGSQSPGSGERGAALLSLVQEKREGIRTGGRARPASDLDAKQRDRGDPGCSLAKNLERYHPDMNSSIDGGSGGSWMRPIFRRNRAAARL